MSIDDGPIAFVGGTGRSGTHVLGRLIGSHRLIADVPIEARFHCNKLGLADLLAGRATLAEHLEKLRGFWWHRVRVDGQPRGLYNLGGRREFDAAVDRFEAGYATDPDGAARRLMRELLWPVAERAGKPGLVEMSSHNLRAAPTLARLFPGARFVHAVRDGRDSAASVTGKTWGPRTISRAIDWWVERLRAIDAGVRGLEGAAAVHVVVLDELVAGNREAGFAALTRFVSGSDEDAGMRAYFDAEMDARAAHAERWRSELGRVGRARITRRYERALARLEAEGNHAAPALRAALEAGGARS